MTDIESIVIACIKAVLRNENYTENQIISILNWNWTEITEVIKKCTTENQ